MELNDNDKALLKYLKVSEADFQKLPDNEQAKRLKDALSAYIKAKQNKRNPVFIENGKVKLPELIDTLNNKPLMVYADKVGQNEGVAEFQVVGYAKDKVLLYSPKSEAKAIKVYQVNISQIITADE
jgi:uncharacterized protein (DUF2252 family)